MLISRSCIRSKGASSEGRENSQLSFSQSQSQSIFLEVKIAGHALQAHRWLLTCFLLPCYTVLGNGPRLGVESIWRTAMTDAISNTADEYASENLAEAFARLQEKLPRMWADIGSSDPGGRIQSPNCIVVVPSLSIELEVPTIQQQAYEERFLFMLFILGQPNVRLIYVTSLAVKPEIIDYYLDILPGALYSNARKRLFLISPEDGSSRPLSQKLLERPRLIEQMRHLIPDRENAHIVPFNTTDLERELAVRLGIPMYAADPDCFTYGTKSGARQLFTEEAINHPLGVENLFSEAEALSAIADLRARKPAINQLITKLNEALSGMGNAVVDLSGLGEPGAAGEADGIRERLRHMRFEVEDATYEGYMTAWQEHGGVVEELVSGAEVHSPSVQMRNTPLGEVELLSTHDQLLGGPSRQTFLGASFPANPAYNALITRDALKIGRRLAREGVIGRYAVDFLLVRDQSGAWRSYAIEINLRKGGTTTPYLTLQYLTRGNYDAQADVFRTLHGQEKYYVANDHLESERYRVFTPDILFDILTDHRLHFDHTTQVGIVLHMISCVGTNGNLGLTAVGNSPRDTAVLYERFRAILDEEALARS